MVIEIRIESGPRGVTVSIGGGSQGNATSDGRDLGEIVSHASVGHATSSAEEVGAAEAKGTVGNASANPEISAPGVTTPLSPPGATKPAHVGKAKSTETPEEPVTVDRGNAAPGVLVIGPIVITGADDEEAGSGGSGRAVPPGSGGSGRAVPPGSGGSGRAVPPGSGGGGADTGSNVTVIGPIVIGGSASARAASIPEIEAPAKTGEVTKPAKGPKS
jgi:hypothetical protein